MLSTTEESRALTQVTDRIRSRFPSAEADRVQQLVTRVHHQYAGRPIREFVPVLVEREVSDALESESRPQG